MKKFLLSFIVLSGFAFTDTASAGMVEITCKEARDYYTEFGVLYVWVGKNNNEKRQLVPVYGMMNMENPKRVCGGRKSLKYYYVKATDEKRCKFAKFCAS
jgi:hypothetical protein